MPRSYSERAYLTDGYFKDDTVASRPVDERLAFIRRTYLTLTMSIIALIGMEALLLTAIEKPAGKQFMLQWFASPVSILVVLALFIGGGFLARYMARAAMPPAVKYLGLALYTGIQALFLLPIIYISTMKYGLSIVNEAALLTFVVFAGLTLTVFLTKKDFSFLGGIISIASWSLLGILLVAILIPGSFGVGLWFSFAFVALAAAAILYNTSNVLHHYHPSEHVGAALELLADVVLLFYHILRILYLTRE
ncbi:MAG: Bax inhibitor-1 family protein [Zavarzinella sp.]